MAGETLPAMNAEPDGITFEIGAIAVVEKRLEVRGRWYGVRGRRFMRPTLTFRSRADASEKRVLADLEHKPWAAQDGDDWLAAFPLGAGLQAAAELELAVAPDITVALAGGAGAAKPGTRRKAKTVASAVQARSPRIRADPVRGRPRERSPELQRLRERLDSAEQSTDHERAKRETVDQALEQERRSGRRLKAELGRLRAELELASAIQRELDSASAALDTLRSGAQGTTERLEQAQRELDAERVTTQGLRRQLADAEAAVKRLTRPDTAPRQAPQPSRERAPVERSREHVSAEWASADPLHPAERHHPVPPRTQRPLNPALRSRSWLGRGLALMVMLIVIAAIVLVIRSTVG